MKLIFMFSHKIHSFSKLLIFYLIQYCWHSSIRNNGCWQSSERYYEIAYHKECL